MSEKALLVERNGPFGSEIYYIQPQDQQTIVAVSTTQDGNKVGSKLLSLFKELFLPQGYPSSVSEDYIYYQKWDTFQAFCSSINGILATQAVLKGVGVGDASSTPLAATITWVWKDGTGHLGRILFAWWKGSSLDSESKKWRLVADILNDVALFIEVSLPLFHGFTTYALCCSTIMKAIVGVAGGATRAALTQHHAVRGNLGDVAAKDGSQETAVNLIASVFGILIIYVFKEYILKYEMNIWLPFFLFTVLHIMANYFAVKSVCLNTFNEYRFVDAFYHYMFESKFVTPEEVNKREPIFFKSPMSSRVPKLQISIGNSMQDVIKKNKFEVYDIKNIIQAYEDFEYVLLVSDDKKKISVSLKDSADSKIILQSYFHALCALMLRNIFTYSNNPLDYIKELKEKVQQKWPKFIDELSRKGWIFDRHLISCGEWRIQ